MADRAVGAAFLVLPVVASDLYLGNIHVLLAAAIVRLAPAGPALWAIPLLTKPSCGVGLLWYVVRGEWRRLGVALGVTAALARGSVRARADLWPKWIDYVLATGVSPDLGSAHFVARSRCSSGFPPRCCWSSGAPARTGPGRCPPPRCSALPVLWLVGLAMLTGAFALSAWGPLRDFGRRWTRDLDSDTAAQHVGVAGDRATSSN